MPSQNRSRILHWRRAGSAAALAASLMLPTIVASASPRTGPDPYAALLARLALAQEPKFRVIYNDDAEIDGLSEFMRFLLYGNEFADSLIGIVYTSSEFHYRGDPNANPPIPSSGWTCCDLVPGQDRIQTYQDIIGGTGYYGRFGGYTAAYPFLKKNDPRYPTPSHLLSLIRVGNVDNVSEMDKVTDGSTLIKTALLANDDRPLWLVTGAGANTIAAALKQIADEYQNTPRWQQIRSHIVATTHLYLILDQDASFKDYIRLFWPDIDATLNRFQFAGIAYNASTSNRNTPKAQSYYTAKFVARYVKGPMLGSYPTAQDGSFLSEGDAPMYLNLLHNGLRSFESPTYGGWGGRFAQAASAGWSDIPDYFTTSPWQPGFASDPSWFVVSDSGSGSTDPVTQQGYPLARWTPAFQDDMLALSQWQTASYADANHPPAVYIPAKSLNVQASPGETVPLHALAADPDGRQLRQRWFQYPEAGTYPGTVSVPKASSLDTSVRVPNDALKGQTIHLILEVSNDGAPPMTRYQRVVITVR